MTAAALAGNPWSDTASRPVNDLDHDLEIVERHRRGDPEAFDEVFREHQETVYNVALRMSGDPFDAADLAQETFLRIYRHLAKFKGHSALKTWIYRVALNHCRSKLARRRLPMQPLLGPDGETERDLPDPARGPEERAVAHDEGRRVMAALAELPVAFREAVVLRDLEGLSYEEIAAVLKVRIGTVRSRIARGRDKLRTVLEEEDTSEREGNEETEP